MLDILEDKSERNSVDQTDISLNPTKPEPLSETEVVDWLQTRIEADGEIATTTRDLEARWSWDKNKISRFLDRLDGTQFHIERDKSGTRIGPKRDTIEIVPVPVRAESDSKDFDWSAVEDSIVQHQADTVAVYLNPHNALVIRKERSWNDDDDLWIVISPGNIQAFINRCCELAGIGGYDPSRR